MRYRRLDPDDDMCFGAQQADFWRDAPEAVAQACITRLRQWLGEWYLDLADGTPYQQAVLGHGRARTAEAAIRARIRGTQGLRRIDSLSFALNPDTRRASIEARITTIYGQTTVTEVL